MEYTNEYEIKVIAFPRSGHHAIINWICKHFPSDKIVFLQQTARQSYEKRNPFDFSGVPWEYRECLRKVKKELLIYNVQTHANIPERGTFSLKDACSKEWERHRNDMVGLSRNRFDCLILRDPFNLIDSSITGWNNSIRQLLNKTDIINIWKEHAREFLGQTRYLKSNPVYISYNKWFKDEEYRRFLSKCFNIPFSDAGLQDVPVQGNGSTFDNRRFDGNAQQMKTAERWKNYKDIQLYRDIFKDRELVALSEDIFGHIEGTEELLGNGVS